MTLSKGFHLLFVILVVGIYGTSSAEPRHIYLTYSDTPETSIDINIILKGPADSVQVFYDSQRRHEVREDYEYQQDAEYVPSTIELADKRRLYVATLKKLKPDTEYAFVAGEDHYGYSRELRFRTLPGGDAPIRFVNGGDMGVDTRAKSVQRVAGTYDPDFAVVGGDLAYADGLLAKAPIWDQWLDNWNTFMRRSDGCLIPIVAAIGNHEVNKYVTEDAELRSPWYIPLFGRQGDELYYSRKVGNHMVFFVLDSGYHNAFDGEQADWLRGELERYRDVPHKFAVYHMPLYPAFSNYDHERRRAARAAWGPLFDEFNVRVAFEHDDHVAKRSKPIRANKVDTSGTVYIGDGAFGRESRNVDRNLRWYNAMEESVVHFWLVDVDPDQVTLQAIDRKRGVFDSVTLPQAKAKQDGQTPSWNDAFANRVYEAWQSGEPMPQLSVVQPNASLEDGYLIQQKFVTRAFGPDGIGGFKAAGVGSREVHSPLTGIVPASGVLSATDRIIIDLKEDPHRHVETEIGYIFNHTIVEPLDTVDELRRHVKAVAAIVEVPGGATEQRQPSTQADLLAWNINAKVIVVGMEHDPDMVDVDAIEISLKHNGETINTARGDQAAGGQWDTLLRAVNRIVGQGFTILPSHVFTNGALGKIVKAEPGQYHADFGALGILEIEVR